MTIEIICNRCKGKEETISVEKHGSSFHIKCLGCNDIINYHFAGDDLYYILNVRNKATNIGELGIELRTE
jgi:hypothetical protein